MFAIHTRYRGRDRHRARLVADAAAALSTIEGLDAQPGVVDVEDIVAVSSSARATVDVVLAFLSDGEWSIGIGVAPLSRDIERAKAIAARALPGRSRAGTVRARVVAPGIDTADITHDVEAVFTLLNHVLAKRSFEGREATALVRSGYSQTEAAHKLGISKQAMSQRLQAAGWPAETAGWRLAIHTLQRADSLS